MQSFCASSPHPHPSRISTLLLKSASRRRTLFKGVVVLVAIRPPACICDAESSIYRLNCTSATRVCCIAAAPSLASRITITTD